MKTLQEVFTFFYEKWKTKIHTTNQHIEEQTHTHKLTNKQTNKERKGKERKRKEIKERK